MKLAIRTLLITTAFVIIEILMVGGIIASCNIALDRWALYWLPLAIVGDTLLAGILLGAMVTIAMSTLKYEEEK